MAVCPVPTAQRSVPWSLQPDAVWVLTLPFFAVASVVAIITMHDAMGVRHETGEQAQVLNQMIDQWIEVSEKNARFPAEHASEGDGRPYAAAGRGRRTGRCSRRLPVSAGLRHSFFTQECTAATENLHLKDV